MHESSLQTLTEAFFFPFFFLHFENENRLAKVSNNRGTDFELKNLKFRVSRANVIPVLYELK